MKKALKKGFTIVELAIVIAVIAILAAVLIPTFTNIIRQANLSNDQSMIRNMNTTLAVESASQPEIEYAGDAITVLNANGFAGKYSPYSSGYHYGYHLESKKMYLVDSANNVVFPDINVRVGDLWLLWSNNATDKVVGATKYVSLVNVSGKGGYFATHFAEDPYTLDLAGHYIAYTGEVMPNVTVVNGILVSGAQQGDSVEAMEQAEATEISGGTAEAPTVYENKVFDCSGANDLTVYKAQNVIYKNCYFYNCIDSCSALFNRTYENCTFIDAENYIFNLQSYGDKYTGNLTVKDCTFINCKRVFNMPIGVYGQTGDGSITVTGNTFYGVTGNDRVVIQLNCQEAATGNSANGAEFKYLDITISDNNFVEVSTSQAGLISIHETVIKNPRSEELVADHFTFENNTVNSSIPVEKYVVNDDGKTDSAFDPYYVTAFKKALTDKMIAGRK